MRYFQRENGFHILSQLGRRGGLGRMPGFLMMTHRPARSSFLARRSNISVWLSFGGAGSGVNAGSGTGSGASALVSVQSKSTSF